MAAVMARAELPRGGCTKACGCRRRRSRPSWFLTLSRHDGYFEVDTIVTHGRGGALIEHARGPVMKRAVVRRDEMIGAKLELAAPRST